MSAGICFLDKLGTHYTREDIVVAFPVQGSLGHSIAWPDTVHIMPDGPRAAARIESCITPTAKA